MGTPLLYVPGYQERFKPGNPGHEIKKLAEKKGIYFKKIILPGDTFDSDEDSKFSLHHSKTRIRENIIKIFRCVDNNTIPSSDGNITFGVYSLLAYPSMDALLEIPQELESRISKISMIHPALNPLLSVSIMDWLVNKSLEIPQNLQYYLDGVPEEKFGKIIGEWRGDGPQFQSDLDRFKDSDGRIPQSFIDIYGDRLKLISRLNDEVVYGLASDKAPCRKYTLRSHKPNLTREQIIEILGINIDNI